MAEADAEPPPRTGDPQVDAALDRLVGSQDDTLDRQVEVGDEVHRTLQARLSAVGHD